MFDFFILILIKFLQKSEVETNHIFIQKRPKNCTLRGQTVYWIGAQFCLYFPGFQKQVFTHVKILSERSSEMKEQKKNKGGVFVAESLFLHFPKSTVWPLNVNFFLFHCFNCPN